MILYLSNSLRTISFIWPTRLIILPMGEVLCFGFNLVVLNPSDSTGHDTYCIVAIEDKKMGFISYCMSLSLYIMSSFLRCYSVCHELNTLDACWIAVDVWSNSSRCRKYRSTCLRRDAYMYDHCLRYRHDFARFYQLLDSNLFTHRNSCYHERSL